jgi:ABC-type branched-subunit amino acid transport system ATPase component
MVEKIPPPFEIRNLTVCRGKRTIVENFSLSIESGAVVMLTGRNGAGKSTLLQAVAGLLPVRSGAVFINGQDVSNVPCHLRLQSLITTLLQGNQIFPNMSVKEHFQIVDPNFSGWAQNGNDQNFGDADAILLKTFEDKWGTKAKFLSGGEKALLAFAVALVNPSQVLLLDEPVAGIDNSKAPVLAKSIKNFIQSRGGIALVVEQDLEPWHQIVKRSVTLNEL